MNKVELRRNEYHSAVCQWAWRALHSTPLSLSLSLPQLSLTSSSSCLLSSLGFCSHLSGHLGLPRVKR